MAGETIRVYGTQKTLEANGAAIANNAIGAADDATVSQADTSDYPDGVFVLMGNFTTAPTANRTIDLIIQPLDIDGTNDAPDPTATHLHHHMGVFRPKAVTGAQYMYCEVFNLPRAFKAWLYNNNTGQSLPAGWTLKFTPLALKPAA